MLEPCLLQPCFHVAGLRLEDGERAPLRRILQEALTCSNCNSNSNSSNSNNKNNSS